MQIERYRDRFRDVIGLIVTPMNRSYAVDEGALRAQIDWCFAQGATGIVATGSIGEFLHLEDDERRRVLEVVLDQTRRYPGKSAFAMTSGATTLQAMRWTNVAAELGYDCGVLIAPYYWKVGEREAFDHFRTIAELGPLPVCVYHNPALSKFLMSPAFFRRVAELDNVVCVKEVETELQHLEAVADALEGRAIYLQTFRAYLTGRLLGSNGGQINVFAVPACVAIDEAWRRGDLALAEEIQRRLNRVFPRGGEAALGALGMTKTTASVVTGIDMGPARPPYLAPDDAEERITKRLPELYELVPAMRPERRDALHPVS
ncbi:MAG TPA: dihydrodipicolinate synthase family protein [Candidatus Elarobacter sp.]|jgi:4-hydroxy-tetrahydrodipicolinate synthase|nr:dihydrodipicolinate synthase family protein [Candidatus Elarobacter sp.]